MDKRRLGQVAEAVSVCHGHVLIRTHGNAASRYYIDPHRVVVVGKPSAAMAKRIEEEEKARIAEQKQALGEEGLKKAEAELEAAKKEHDKEIPTDVLTSFPVPSVKSISWIPVQSLQEVGSSPGRRKAVEQSNNAELARHVQADGSPLPFFVQYDHVEVRVRSHIRASEPRSLAKSPTSWRSAHTCHSQICQTSFARTPSHSWRLLRVTNIFFTIATCSSTCLRSSRSP